MKDTEEPAFPFVIDLGQRVDWFTGMTLRDYFAAHAPTPPDTWKAKKDDAENIIEWRWAYADAMLEARKK